MKYREIINTLTTAALAVYDPMEARAVARFAAEELWGISSTLLVLNPDGECCADNLTEVAERLASGEPVQYVVGSTEWCDLRLEVGKGVLIPRPETEELVRWIESDHRSCEGLRVVDLGTGSGAIAIALAGRLSGSRVTAFDISDDALAIARRNGAKHAPQVEFLKGDMLALDPIEGLDIVVSNPPYVPQSDLASMHRNVKEWEPHTALFVPDERPLMFYEAVVDFAVRSLKKGGHLYCEIYEHLAEQTVEMAAQRGLPDGEIRCDIMDRPRMIRWTKA